MEQFYKKGLGGIRDRAQSLIKEKWLERWWAKKYQQPWRTSPLFASYTKEQLLLEFVSDFIEEHPDQALALGAGEDVQFVTGDKAIDKIEADLAEGKECPDLFDAFLTKDEAKRVKEQMRIKKEKILACKLLKDEGGIKAPVEHQVEESDESIEQPFFDVEG